MGKVIKIGLNFAILPLRFVAGFFSVVVNGAVAKK